MSKVFKNFSNLAESLLVKIHSHSNKYNLESLFLCYLNFTIPEVLHIKHSPEEKIFKIMGNIEISKAMGIDKNPG